MVVTKIKSFKESVPIFDLFNIELRVEQIFRRRIPLSCGGEIEIHETEALTAVEISRSTISIIANLSMASTMRHARKFHIRSG